MRRAAKIDDNQKSIVKTLRAIGCSVDSLAACGNGIPDILVGVDGKNILMEIKDGSKSPSKRRLTEDQVKWHEAHKGQVEVIKSEQEAIDFINNIRRAGF